MNTLKIYDVRVLPGDASFLLVDGKTAILYDAGFGFTGYGIAENIRKIIGSRQVQTAQPKITDSRLTVRYFFVLVMSFVESADYRGFMRGATANGSWKQHEN